MTRFHCHRPNRSKVIFMCSLSMHNHNRVTENATHFPNIQPGFNQMSNQAQVNWTGRSHCQEDGEIQLKEAKNPTTAATATKPRFHGMVHPMTLHEEVNHRKMTRANCCSSSRKQTQMGKVICQMLHKSQQYQVLKLDLQIPEPTSMLSVAASTAPPHFQTISPLAHLTPLLRCSISTEAVFLSNAINYLLTFKSNDLDIIFTFLVLSSAFYHTLLHPPWSCFSLTSIMNK